MAHNAYVGDVSQRTAARIAGAAYLITVAFVVSSNFGVREPLLVGNDMAETIRRIAASQLRFRLSAAFDLIYCTGSVALLSALYVVLRPVNRYLALLAALWKLVYVVTAMLMVLSLLTMVRLATQPAYLTAGAETVQALVRMNYSATGTQYYVGLLFWALSATVIGWLWWKSGYIPAALALFGLVSAAWCVLCTFIYLIDPAFTRLVNLWWFDTPLALFDIALSVWLLTKGLRGDAAEDLKSHAVLPAD